MTTRKDLETELATLRTMRERAFLDTPAHAALTSSIARLEALLSLNDEHVMWTIEATDQSIADAEAEGQGGPDDWAVAFLRVVRTIFARTP